MLLPKTLARAIRWGWTAMSLATLPTSALISACAVSPHPSPAPVDESAAPCSRLDAEIGRAEADRERALAHQQGAWHLVLPFAVAARYAGAKSDERQADQQLAELHANAQRQGCHVWAR